MRVTLCLHYFGCIIILLGFMPRWVEAQDETLTPLYTSVAYANALWSSDSQRFASQNPTVAEYSWTVFNVLAGTLEESSTPCPFGILDTRRLTYALSQGISQETAQGVECVFWSPDDHFMLAAGQDELDMDYSDDAARSTVLADFRLNRILDIPLSNPIWHRSPISTQVLWSDNSTAFVLATPSLYGPPDILFYAYVTGYAQQSDEQAEPQVRVQDFREIRYNELNYHVIDIYDVSADGSMVLLRAASDTFPSQYPVFVWNIATDTYQIIAGINTDSVSLNMGASFAFDVQSFIIVDNDGVVQYDLQTGAIEVLRDDISTRWVDAAYFSPNGKWLALFDNRDNGAADVYMVEVNLGATS